MPCSCEGYPNDDTAARWKAKADEATALLCGLCRAITNSGGGILLHRVPGLDEWWDAHRRSDHERVKREALAKLTVEERAALGLKYST